MEEIKIRKISAALASAVMASAGLTDPDKGIDSQRIAETGENFELTTPEGVGVFTVRRLSNTLWVAGAGSEKSEGLLKHGLPIVEAMAKLEGLERVGFQTARPGLVRIAKRHGYRIAGIILEKRI